MPLGRRATWIMLLPLASACVTFKRPQGDWSRPVDLPYAEGVMDDAKVGVTCGAGPRDEASFGTAQLEACRRITRLVQGMGATVVVDGQVMPKPGEGDGEAEANESDEASTAVTTTPVDFSVLFVDRRAERDYCGWTLPLFVVFIGLFPCVEDIDSEAELRILDQNGLLTRKLPLKTATRTIYGLPALYYLATDWLHPKRRARDRALGGRLSQYVRNVVYTHRVRGLLATGEL